MSCNHCTANNLRSPSSSTPVYKEECTLCFHTWDAPDGLFVCLTCFNGGCEKHARMHALKQNHSIAVNIKRTKKPQPVQDEPPQKITKLAIGVPGGLSTDSDSEQHFDYASSPYCFSCDKSIPSSEPVQKSIDSVLAANSAAKQEDMKSWENQIIQCEHTITLTQNENAPKLEKKSLAHCSDCELNANLWLCLTCGHLGCGRKNYDGSGGNGHALQHADSSQHHIVCKLGTISPEGTADIHCYSCDEMRLDPFLSDHLATFGINIANEQKTEKSLAELELEQNLNLELAKVLEGGQELTKVYGPGYTGLRNLGNTCYMASALQVLFAIPQFQSRYLEEQHISQCNEMPSKCYHCQMYKLAHGLLSGKYSTKKTDDEEEQEGIPPRMLKSLICKDHPEFSTMRQQDAYEFFQFLNKTVQQKERITGNDPSKVFEFSVRQTLQCNVCNKVRYSSVKEREISLPMPVEAASPPLKNVEGEKESDRAKRERESIIPFNACIDSYIQDEHLTFKCPNCNQNTDATKNYRIESFPDILTVHMRRFVFEDWVPRKLAVRLDVPSTLDLERTKPPSKLPDSQLLPDTSVKSSAPTINQDIVNQLLAMDIPRVRCERAVVATNNSSADAAMNWYFEHMEDADIDEPIKTETSATAVAVPEELVGQLCDMGFTVPQAKKALRETQCNMDRAVEWLFSHADEPVSEDVVEPVQQQQEVPMEIEQGGSKYRLFGFIVHLGSSAHSGHYVAYVHKEGRWVQFNDRKVAESKEPPIGDAYLYFFERI